MKKVISIVLLLTLCLSLFAGCKNETDSGTNYDLASAKAYLTNMYQTAGKGEVMVLTADKDVLAKVTIDGIGYEVSWAVKVTSGSADDVKVGESKKANQVLLDINEKPAADVLFTATATIKAGDGTTETVSFNYKVAASAAAGLTDEQIVEKAYELENGEIMEGNVTLTGVITMVKTPYDASYQNITVVIQIGELTDKRIECYRLKGDGADKLGMGDTITVTGVLKNYNGTIEFDAGCTLDKVVPGEKVEAPADPKEIVNAAYALEAGASLPYSATLTGVITEIKTPYDDGYKNISVIFAIEGCEDKPILCYRLKGDGAADLAVGDTITVTGYIVNYNGTIEYTSGCVLDAVGDSEGGSTEKPDDNKPDNDKPVPPSGSAANIANGTYIIADNKGNTVVGGKCPSSDKSYGYLYDDYTADEKHATTIYTITSVGGGKYTIQDCDGRYLGTSGTYRSFQLYTKNEGNNCLWTISTGKNSEYIVKNVDSGRYIDYSAEHSSFGVYLDTELPEDGMVKLIAAKAADKPEDKPDDKPTEKPSTSVSTPEAGVAYKFGMIQENISTTDVYYLAGGMSGYYMATTTNANAAIKVYLEATEGGYYLYTMENGAKVYINMVVSGTHVNGAYEATASTVYSWDAEHKSLVATVNDELYWFATRNDNTYDTIGPCKVSYDGFYCMLYAA